MDETISLLPFIEPGGDGFHLDIPVFDRDRTSFQGYSYPFQIIEKGHNFSIIVKAELKINDSAPFKSLFLLVQRDDYPVSPGGLIPFTNTGIDRTWHETIQSYYGDKNVFIVPEQLSQEENATAFRSLFYCKKQQKFFHPPCPECGTELELCRDDNLLISKSLPPFSTSLKRYLFCPRCHAAKTNDEFYQFAHAAEDLVFTKDRFDLIKDFNKLKSMVSGSFPCPACPNHAECYITGEKAASHISFFSFYPFHMLFFDAEPINAVDFLPLISGAPFEEGNTFSFKAFGAGLKKEFPPREHPLFFFEGEERFFLEVLLLKLSFFEEFSLSLFQKLEKNGYPMTNLSVQSIWIRPESTGNNLPFFWSFKLSIIDLLMNSPENHVESVLTKNTSLHFMASLWLYTFLVNKNQGLANVYDKIGKLLEKGLEDPVFHDYNLLIKAAPSVAAENIFWNPANRSIPAKWHGFWIRIMSTGLAFFNGGKEHGLDNELKQLIYQIKTLKQEIKEELFSSQNIAAPLTIETKIAVEERKGLSSSERQIVLQVLKRLKTKWTGPEESSPDSEEDILETIVLSSPETEPDTGFDDILEKTMIMPGPQTESAGEEGFDAMEKTVIISSAGRADEESDFFSEDGDLDKTIVIPPKK